DSADRVANDKRPGGARRELRAVAGHTVRGADAAAAGGGEQFQGVARIGGQLRLAGRTGAEQEAGELSADPSGDTWPGKYSATGIILDRAVARQATQPRGKRKASGEGRGDHRRASACEGGA